MSESEEIIDMVRSSPTETWEPGEPTVDQWESIEVINRPRWPKVVGIFSIVWGGLGLCCLGLGTAWTAILPSMVESQLNGDPMPSGFQMQIADWLIALVSFALSLLLIFAGITSLSYRPVTRLMHLGMA